jgi:hypothetical protein
MESGRGRGGDARPAAPRFGFMSRFIKFVVWFAAVLGGIAAFNLIIGVFGLNCAIISLVVFITFAVYTSFRPQPEEK